MYEEKITDFTISTQITLAVAKASTCYFDQNALRYISTHMDCILSFALMRRAVTNNPNIIAER
jgi:hypothetical protein